MWACELSILCVFLQFDCTTWCWVLAAWDFALNWIKENSNTLITYACTVVNRWHNSFRFAENPRCSFIVRRYTQIPSSMYATRSSVKQLKLFTTIPSETGRGLWALPASPSRTNKPGLDDSEPLFSTSPMAIAIPSKIITEPFFFLLYVVFYAYGIKCKMSLFSTIRGLL
jgi:hypothetical protein